MKPKNTYVALFSLSFVCLTFLGCGLDAKDMPDIGTVTGKVTLNGKPLVGATVFFFPELGRRSSAITKDDGTYELNYTLTAKGAKIGKHTVRISTFEESENDPDKNEKSKPKREEEVPAKYNKKTTLTADVKAGENTFDFDLKK